MLPIIEAIGTCQSELEESVLLMLAVNTIEEAEKFHGIPSTELPTEKCDNAITVSVKVIFRNEKDLSDFIQFIQKSGLNP